MALKVEFDELQDIAANILDNKNECDSMIDETAQIVDTLVGDGFEGAAADAFQEKFEEVKSSLKEAMEAMEGMSTMLTNIATAMEETDEQLAQQVSGQ